MAAIGYEADDGKVAYVVEDDTLENIITYVVYKNKNLTTGNGETKTAESKQKYFNQETRDEDDTRFRFLKQKDGVWVIRDYFGRPCHDMTITNVMEGGKRKKTRKNRTN
jgi:hypothetical protein